MKFFKKLIPLATIAGVGMGVVPLATSCAAKLPAGWVDGKAKLDTSNFAKHTGGYEQSMDVTKLTNEYFEQDIKVINDDFAYYLTQLNELSNALKINLGKNLRVSKFEFEKIQGKLSDFKIEDETKHTASYTIEIDTSLKVDANIDDFIAYISRKLAIQEKFEFGDIKFELELKGKLTFTKVPVIIYDDYVTSAQHILSVLTGWIIGLSLVLDTNKMVKDEYKDWQLDAWLSTKGFVSNDDLFVDLGWDMAKDQKIKITQEDLLKIRLEKKFKKIVMTAFSILGGWSTYYYSDYEHKGKLI